MSDFRSISNILRIDRIPVIRAATWGYVQRKYFYEPRPGTISRFPAKLYTDEMERLIKSFTGSHPIVGDLKIPRIFGANREARIVITDRIETEAKLCALFSYGYTYFKDREVELAVQCMDCAESILIQWAKANCTPKNAPSELKDWLIGREEGDTPIVVASRMINFLLAYEQIRCNLTAVQDWLLKLTKYVDSYVTSVPNNHQSWKAAFLLTAGHVLHHREYLNKGMAAFDQCMQLQFNKHGGMPFELDRGELSAYYTLMNLEALIEGHRIVRIYSLNADYRSKLQRAKDDFKKFLDQPWQWESRYNLDTQVYPVEDHQNRIDKWYWIMGDSVEMMPQGSHSMLTKFL